MCGIAAIFNIKEQTPDLRNKALSMAKKIRHRGPDWSGIYCGGSAILAHERLSIVDPQSGGQPLYSPDRKQILAVNGEIYNHRDIRNEMAGEYVFQTGSDCEVILALYRRLGVRFIERLSGIFAFALYDEERDEFLIARDPIGVIPLYIGRDKDGKVYCASELKALEGLCDEYEPFLPGHYYWSREGEMKPWYKRDWTGYDTVKDNYTEKAANETRTSCASATDAEAYAAQVSAVRTALEDAVRRQLMSDVPYGVLLSGGLDSSVISAVARLYADKRVETDGKHGKAVALSDCPGTFVYSVNGDSIGRRLPTIDGKRKEGIINPTTGIGEDDKVIYKPGMPYSSDCALGYTDGATLTQGLVEADGQTKRNSPLGRRTMLQETARHPGGYVPSLGELAKLYYLLECAKPSTLKGLIAPLQGDYLTCSESDKDTFYLMDFSHGIVTGRLSKRYTQAKLRLFYLF